MPNGTKLSEVLAPPQRTQRIAVAYAWAIGFWLTLALVTTFQERLSDLIDPDTPAALQMRLSQSLLLLSVRYASFALLTPPIFYLVRRFAVRWEKPLRGIVAYLIGAVPFVFAYAAIRWSLAPIWSFRLGHFVSRTMSSYVGIITGTLGVQISVYVALVVAAHTYEYFVRVKTRDLEQAELQQALSASELQALKSQLLPHFLFNTLHGISTLIDNDRIRAKAMVLKLSSLLRTALQYGSSDLITFDSELRFFDSYLDLEKMRLGTRLDVRKRIDPSATHLLIPQLILQPLVENAIVHGIACCREGGWIEIAAQQLGNSLEIDIRNSVGARSESGMGLGLKNTEARLRHLYSGEASLVFTLTDGVARITLILPVLNSAAHSAPASTVAEAAPPIKAST